MRIQTNVSALNAHRSMGANQANAAKNIERLSSGFRINSAKDDAAGLAISNKLGADVRALKQASRNASQGLAMLQTADGAAQTIGDILTRMKELVTQANSANIGTERDKIQAEFTALTGEIDRITSTTQYQGTTLLEGGFGTKVTGGTWDDSDQGIHAVGLSGAAAGTYTIANNATDGNNVTISHTESGTSQTVAVTADGQQSIDFTRFGISLDMNAGFSRSNGTDTAGDFDGVTIVVGGSAAAFQVSSSGQYGGNDQVSVSAIDLRTGSTGLNLANALGGGATLADAIDGAGASDANRQQLLVNIDSAIDKVNTALGTVGAAMNRIDYAQQNTETLIQNTEAAKSVIKDADMAFEMMEFTKNNILSQAAQAMLAQANQQPQGILQLLR